MLIEYKSKSKLQSQSGPNFANLVDIGKVWFIFLTNFKVHAYIDGKKQSWEDECGNNENVLKKGNIVYYRYQDDLVGVEPRWSDGKVNFVKTTITIGEFYGFTAAPSDPNYLTYSQKGLIRAPTYSAKLDKVFPNEGRCDWNAGISCGRFAVLAAYAKEGFLAEEGKSRTKCNMFILVRTSDFEILNKSKPLKIEVANKGHLNGLTNQKTRSPSCDALEGRDCT